MEVSVEWRVNNMGASHKMREVDKWIVRCSKR